jgi:NAD+ kinase
MASQFRKVAMVGRHADPRVAEPMTLLVAHLTKLGIEVMTAEEMTLDVSVTRCAESALSSDADMMIAIGGDGTMLYAGRLTRDSDIPLLGINRGRLGFLADVSPEEMLASVDHILNGNYSIESRLLLEAQLRKADGETISGIAFNDVVLQRHETGRMVDFETSVAGHFVNMHSGDGLIVATPTGSTAYALSCGGPIVEPQLDALLIVPICPHTLTDRPLVIAANQPIEIRLLQREDTRATVAIDGHSIGPILPGDLLTIQAAAHRINLIHPPAYDFYGILRSKLFWGRDSRKREQDGT